MQVLYKIAPDNDVDLCTKYGIQLPITSIDSFNNIDTKFTDGSSFKVD